MADTALIFNIIAKDKTSGAFDKVKAGAATAGVAIGAVLMAGVSTAIEKGKLDAKLAAQLGASPAQAKEIGKLSGSVFAAGFGDDLPGVTTAIKSAAQNGLVSMDKISSDASKATIQNLLTVGSVLEEDTDRVSAAVSQMLRTGMAGSAEAAMDLLVRATQKGVNKSQDLLDTLNEYGGQFQKLGLGGKNAMGLLSQAIQAGARDSDFAADALKEFSIRAVDGSKKSAAGFEALGLSAEGMTAQFAKGGDGAAEGLDLVLDKLRAMKDPVKQNAAAVALFGTKAEDLGAALFAMDLSTAGQEMGKIKGATAAAASTAAAGVAGWGALGRQLQTGLVETMNQALPAVNAVFGFIQRNQGWVKPLALGIGALAVAIGIATAVQYAWNVALSLSPIGLVVIGIAALIAIIALVATKTRFFQTIWNATWGFMKRVGAWFAGPFAGFFVTTWNKIIVSFNLAKSKIMTAVNFVKNIFVGMRMAHTTVVNNMIAHVTKLVNFIRGAPGKIGNALHGMFAPLWNGFRGFVNQIIAGWNRLSFGIPGFSFAGVSVPGTSVGTPDIPFLDRGAGMVRQSGLAVIHRGESVTPAAKVTPFRSGGGGGGGTITLKSDGSRMSNMLLELLREAIRERGGDPIRVLTPR